MLSHSIAAALLVAAGAEPATTPVATLDPLSGRALLDQILPKLKRTLRDPYSVRDFSICAPRGVKWKDGRPERWTVLFSFNARNAYGGYTGVETWFAMFRKGRLSGELVRTQLQSTDGLMGLLNRPVQRQLEQCEPIPDDELQRLMSGGQGR